MPDPIASSSEGSLKPGLHELVRGAIEDTLNGWSAEAIIEMYFARVSVRRIENVSEILWGSSVSAFTFSNLNEKVFASVEEWRNRPLKRAHSCVYVGGIHLKRSWKGPYENVSAMAAIGVNDNGYREVVGATEGFTESTECWWKFLSWLKSRGLRGVRVHKRQGGRHTVGSIAEVFPDTAHQRRTVRFYRNVLAKVPKSKHSEVAAMLKAIHAIESHEAVEAKELEGSKLREAAKIVMDGCAGSVAKSGVGPSVRNLL